jgi:hypothetical protein
MCFAFVCSRWHRVFIRNPSLWPGCTGGENRPKPAKLIRSPNVNVHVCASRRSCHWKNFQFRLSPPRLNSRLDSNPVLSHSFIIILWPALEGSRIVENLKNFCFIIANSLPYLISRFSTSPPSISRHLPVTFTVSQLLNFFEYR